MRYDLQIPAVSETMSFICMVQAHSEDVREIPHIHLFTDYMCAQALTYIDSGAAEIGGLLREEPYVKPGSILHKFSHAMDDVPAWEAHGTSYGFSSIGIPITHPGLDSFNQAIAVWVDEKVQSKSNMDVLADYGVDMDHPCVRVYAKEEVDANRKFLVASAESFTMHEFLKVCSFGSFCNHPSPHVFAQKVSVENIQSGKVKIQVMGKHAGNPETVLQSLEKRRLAVEKQRDELEPQWLRE